MIDSSKRTVVAVVPPRYRPRKLLMRWGEHSVDGTTCVVSREKTHVPEALQISIESAFDGSGKFVGVTRLQATDVGIEIFEPNWYDPPAESKSYRARTIVPAFDVDPNTGTANALIALAVPAEPTDAAQKLASVEMTLPNSADCMSQVRIAHDEASVPLRVLSPTGRVVAFLNGNCTATLRMESDWCLYELIPICDPSALLSHLPQHPSSSEW